MATIPSVEPTCFRAGSTVQWKRALSDYPAPTWTLEYYFRQLSGTGHFNVTAANSDGDHLVTIARTDTQPLAVGEWRWLARVNDGATYADVAEGVTEIQPDLESDNVDARTDDERNLATVRDLLAGRLSRADVVGYSVAGRSLSFMDKGELLDLEERLAQRVNMQRNRDRRRSGHKRRRQLRIRYG